ncbi:unnamed protein product [Miscanthus lutarioriparius]|uniref:Uncharacterized protein n=1 Tax=Miscanthus lutarioriparius TaxID=422564 RepID=A0A811PPR6_9POAL|nr:unnamed protein product [Miscanthus lutarioriparius]
MEGALSPGSSLISRRGATEVAATTKSIVARRGRGGGATKKELRKANKSRLTNQDAGCAIFSLSVGVSAIIKEYNSAADAQANFAVELPVGEVQEQSNISR